MARQVTHRFTDTTEANAFVAGVEWVNDSSIVVVDIEVGTDFADVILIDDDDDYDTLKDHR